MKKITDFIVRGRYFFLALFILLAGVGLVLSTKVVINEDIMKYLPTHSETKIGKDIMEKEFEEQDSSILNVMFEGLSKKEKNKTLKQLEKIKGVASVSYQNTKEYNKGKYTLYVLNVSDYATSKTATNVYQFVEHHLKPAGMSGSIYDENKPILQLDVVVLAIFCAMVILILLSDSYLEPWLYLISIGIAIFINKGSNIMFESVSSITNSIVAILQLALSMDYSIMLSNRYKQEKERHESKIEAMKEALYQSFKAISSSSVTTIVGLLALVFMSFTIGKDLGFVLAKGVLLSLASIFFCLPALLLIFDKLIAKTKKKAPHFDLTKLGKFIYKTRWVQAILLVFLFAFAYFLKGNVGILYTGSEQDKVGKVFPATNQIALVYNRKYEDLVSKYCKTLEKDKKIDQVLCYSNTINEKLSYDELNQKLKDLGQDVSIEEDLIQLIYYHYYNQDETNKMTLEEFISFVKQEIYPNEKFKNSINQEMKDSLTLLENFTSPTLIKKERTEEELAEILGMRKEDVQKILIYYHSKETSTRMTLETFVKFMLQDVATNPSYASSLDKATRAKLQQLQTFMNLSQIDQKMNASELATLFGMNQNVIEQLFLFYRTTMESKSTMTLHDFSEFALAVSNDTKYQDLFDANTKQALPLLNTLNTLSDDATLSRPLDKTTMQDMLKQLGISLDDATLSLLFMYYQGATTKEELTLSAFVNEALDMAKQPAYQSDFSEEVEELTTIQKLLLSSKQELSKQVLYQMFGVEAFASVLDTLPLLDKMTPLTFVNSLLQSELVKESLNSPPSLLASLQTAQYLLSNTDTSYHVDALASALSKDKSLVSIVFGSYLVNHDGLPQIASKDLLNFLYENQENPLLAPHLKEIKGQFELAHTIINHTNTKYSVSEISQLIGVSHEQVNQIFALYDFTYQETTLTPYEFVNLLLENQENPLIQGKLSGETKKELVLVKEVMESTKKNTSYSVPMLSSLLGIKQDTLRLLFSLYDSKYIQKEQRISLENYVSFLVNDVMNNQEYASNFDASQKEKLSTIDTLMSHALKCTQYTTNEAFTLLGILSDQLDKTLLDLVYMYYGSHHEYQASWKMTIEEFINYLNRDILKDARFDDFISRQKRTLITDAKKTVSKSKKMLVSKQYARAVLNTKYAFEDEETYRFINSIQDKVGKKKEIYVVGNSPMAVEMSKTFDDELNRITLLTMLFIFIVVAFTFKDLIIPFVLVLIIQTAVYITMSAISLTGGSVYFISVLIVQAILMGATIDYAIVYTSYYREARQKVGIKEAIIQAYNGSIHTILSSSSILIIVTLIVANFASAIAAKICETISQGTFAAVILILFLLPGVLATTDKFICRKGYYQEKKKEK